VAERYTRCREDINPTRTNMVRTVLVVILILLLLGALPAWPYSAGWGYYPAGGIGGLLLLILILALLGVI
jgi:Protein of unknown function (DUF3309)